MVEPDVRPLRIVIPLYQGVTQLDFTGPHQFFSRLPDTEVIVAGCMIWPGWTAAMYCASRAVPDAPMRWRPMNLWTAFGAWRRAPVL